MHFDLTSECHVKSVMISHYFLQLKNAVFVDRNSMSLPFKINHVILHLSITPNFNIHHIFIEPSITNIVVFFSYNNNILMLNHHS